MSRKLQTWIKNTEAEASRNGEYFFLFPNSGERELLKNNFPQIDSLLEHGTILKDSRTTTAAILSFSGNSAPVFAKRTNSKGVRFALKYLFRRSRAFRAAIAAEWIRNAGVDTPKVLAVGEHRSGLILQAGYLVTETLPGLTPASKLLRNGDAPQTFPDHFLKPALEITAKLHRAHIIHGDLKLANFYVKNPEEDNWKLGLWDLDSVTRYDKGIPAQKQVRELARIATSILLLSDLNQSLPDSFFSLSDLVRRILKLYEEARPECPIPNAQDVIHFSREHWFSRYPMIHKIQ